MPRSYRHISHYEKEIIELRKKEYATEKYVKCTDLV